MQSCDAQAPPPSCGACDAGDAREHVDTKAVVSAAPAEAGDACALHAARARAAAARSLAIERATDAVTRAERAEALQLAAALAVPLQSSPQHPPTPPQPDDNDDADGGGDDDDVAARTAAAAASLAAPSARKKPRLMLLSDASELATELPQITSLDEATQQEALRKLAATRRGCRDCGALKTPQWRSGPAGAKTLCNACGVRHLKHSRMALAAQQTPQQTTDAAASA
jgi:hypothetical protein